MSIFRPDGALDVRFDLFYDQRWNEIPNEDTRGALAQAGGLGIQRGLPNESGEAQPTRCDLSLNNRDGKYSPRNPFSPLFGKLGRNTQLRARVVGEQFETAPTAEIKSLTSDFLIGNVNNVDAPPGLAEGDVLIAFVTHPGSQTFDQQAHPQGGALWFEIAEVQSFDPNVQPFVAVGRTKVYWKVAGPDEPAQYQFNFDSGPDGIITIVAVQNASHTRPQLIAATEPEFSTSMTSVSSLPGAPSLELRWVAGHGNFLSAPTATWSAPEGFVEEALFDDIDTNAILTSRLLSTLGETGDHVFTVDEPVAFKTAVTVNVLSQDTTPIRATVEVPAWPTRWDPSSVNQPVDEGAGDVWVPIEGAGILRRLGQGAKPLRSPMYRVHMGQADAGFGSANQAHLVAYWPLEEGENAEIGVSPLENVPNARFSGNLNLGDAAPSPGTENLVSVEDTTGRIRMDVPSFPDDWTIFQRWMTGFEFAHDPDAGSGDNVMSFRFVEQHFRWEVTAEVNASGGLDWEITRADLDDDPPVPTTQGTGTGDSAPFYWVEMRKSSNVFQVVVNGVQVLSVVSAGQIGPPTSLEFRILSGADPVLYGHVGVWAIGGGISFNNSLPDFLSAIDGYRGERAGRRIQRLCAEEDIPFYAVGDLDDTPFMGPQPITEFLDALRDAENVDIGFLYEPRDQLGLSYRTRASLQNTVPKLILTFGAEGEIIQPLEPVDDDQQTTNDVTVSRPGGSSAREVQTTGLLSIQEPPNGVGLYDTSVTVNVLSDLDLPNQAGFRLALGTVDEARYPVITLDLLALYEYDKFDLFKRAAELDVGSRMQVQDPPQWLPPDVIDQFAIGFSEVLTEFSWEISTNNRPASPFTEIAEFADEEETPAPDAPGRYDTNGTRTLKDFQINVDTQLPIETTSGQLWTTNNGGVLLRGLAGESVCIPDNPALDITGDLDLRFDGRLFNWGETPNNQTLISKYRPSDDNRSYWLLVTAAGELRLQWTTDGTAGTIINRTANAEIPAGPGERVALRATLDVDDGSGNHVVTFYSAPTIAGPWIRLGDPQIASGTTSIFSGDADLCVGSFETDGALMAGIVHAVEVRDGIDGTVVANPVFEQRARPSSSSIVEFTDDAGNEWSVTGLVNGDLPFDVNLASVQLRVTDIEYMRPFLVDVSSVASGTTGSFSVPAPTGLQEGDLLVAFHATDVGSESSGTIFGGSFWTDIGRQASADGSGRVAVFAKIAGPSEPGSYTVTQNLSADGVVVVAAVRNVRPTRRVIAHLQGFTGSSTSIETPPSNPIAQSFELRWASSESGATYTPPSGFDEQADLNSGGFIGGTLVTRHVRSLQTGRHTVTASGSVADRIGVTVNVIGTQVMTVEQQGINAPAGATKLVPAGAPVALWTPTRYGL